MKYRYNLNELEQANDMLYMLVQEQLLKGNITLLDINQELRIMFPRIYITAFRTSRENTELYAKNMNILLADILVAKTQAKNDLLEIFDFYR